MYMSEEWSDEKSLSLAFFNLFNKIYTFQSIEKKFPKEDFNAKIAYFYSQFVFTEFMKDYEIKSLKKMLNYLAQGNSFEKSFFLVTSEKLEFFEQEMTSRFNNRFNFKTIVFNSRFLWLLFAVAALFIFAFKKYILKERISKLPEGKSLEEVLNEENNMDEDKKNGGE